MNNHRLNLIKQRHKFWKNEKEHRDWQEKSEKFNEQREFSKEREVIINDNSY